MHSEIMLLAQHWLVVFFVMLFIGTLCSKLAGRFMIPDVAVYIPVGIILGPNVLSFINVPSQSLVNQMILLFGASFIIFHGGMISGFNTLRKVWISVTLLSTAGVVVTAIIVAVSTCLIFHIPFIMSLLLGAMLASTDPAALMPIFQKFPIKRKIAHTVIAESAFTDATGAIMTAVIYGTIAGRTVTGWGQITFQSTWLILGGILSGLTIGLAAAALISENERSSLLREYTPMVVTLTVLAAYLAADYLLHASGFMAVFAAGLVIGNSRFFRLAIHPKENRDAHQFMDVISLKLRMFIFILLGSQVDIGALKHFGAGALAVAAVFILIARPAAVSVCLLPDRNAKWKKRELLFFFWTRETGVIAAALAGMAADPRLPEGHLLTAVTVIVILVTLVLQAGTKPLLAQKLGLMEERHKNMDIDEQVKIK